MHSGCGSCTCRRVPVPVTRAVPVAAAAFTPCVSHRVGRATGRQSEWRLLLSGTPVSNSLGELYSLLRFTMPSSFHEGDMDLFTAGGDDSNERLALFRRLLAPFVLRRLKSQVLQELVAKVDVTERVGMSPAQEALYQQILDRHAAQLSSVAPSRVKIDEGVVDLTDGSDAGAGASASVSAPPAGLSVDVKNVFVELRKAANHPLLLPRHYVRDEKVMRVRCAWVWRVRVADVASLTLRLLMQRFRSMARLLHDAEVFGSTCTLEDTIAELRKTSDFQIHCMCRQLGADANPELLDFALPKEILFDCGVCGTAPSRATAHTHGTVRVAPTLQPLRASVVSQGSLTGSRSCYPHW